MNSVELEKSLAPKRVRFAFWVDKSDWYNAANEAMIDSWLTQNLRMYTAIDLEEAFVVLKGQGKLGQNKPKELAQKLGLPEPPVVAFEKVAPAAEPVPEVIEPVAIDAHIPPEITKSVLHSFNADQMRAAFTKYGEAAVVHRYNHGQ